jgi:rhamnulokinase
MIALGQIKNIREARQMIRRSISIQTYEPEDTGDWNDAYERFCSLVRT